jgi:hypothetical protein
MLVVPFAALAVVAWVVALIAAIRLMDHRLPARGLGWYLVRGTAFFSASNFQASGAGIQRIFVLAAVGFALALAGCVVAVLLAA